MLDHFFIFLSEPHPATVAAVLDDEISSSSSSSSSTRTLQRMRQVTRYKTGRHNIHAQLEGEFSVSYRKVIINFRYCSAVIWSCYVELCARCSALSSSSLLTSSEIHPVNMASIFLTQVYLLPQSLPRI